MCAPLARLCTFHAVPPLGEAPAQMSKSGCHQDDVMTEARPPRLTQPQASSKVTDPEKGEIRWEERDTGWLCPPAVTPKASHCGEIVHLLSFLISVSLKDMALYEVIHCILGFVRYGKCLPSNYSTRATRSDICISLESR